MSLQPDPNAATRTWKNAFFVLLFFASIFLLYDFATADGHASFIRSRLLDGISAEVGFGSSVIEHGIDARLVWSKGSVPPTRLLRHAPGSNFPPVHMYDGSPPL